MTNLDHYAVSDHAILEKLGKRIRGLRLKKNITQEALAERTLLAVGTIKALEAGKGKLSTLVSVLRELGALEQLEQILPPITISPIKLAEANVRQAAAERVRASATVRKGKK